MNLFIRIKVVIPSVHLHYGTSREVKKKLPQAKTALLKSYHPAI